MDLPRIDVHTREIEAGSESTWDALIGWLSRGMSTPTTSRFARLLGTDPGEVTGSPGQPGSTVPGFRVACAEKPRELALAGRHHFSEYTLRFEIERLGEDRSLLRATTSAAFPGLQGELYKTAVIRSRAHVVATRRILRSVARRAERARLSR